MHHGAAVERICPFSLQGEELIRADWGNITYFTRLTDFLSYTKSNYHYFAVEAALAVVF